MNFKEVNNKYNTLGILTDEELDFLLEEFSKLNDAVKDKACFLGTPTVYVVAVGLRRLQDIRAARDYRK